MMIVWKRPSGSLITLQDTPNMKEFALSQDWVVSKKVKDKKEDEAKDETKKEENK
tara:strand:- start:266 stop:430 length:165 start_codon:yes stop_codon:yes gene_type:complete